jgi:hypothetical protein
VKESIGRDGETGVSDGVAGPGNVKRRVSLVVGDERVDETAHVPRDSDGRVERDPPRPKDAILSAEATVRSAERRRCGRRARTLDDRASVPSQRGQKFLRAEEAPMPLHERCDVAGRFGESLARGEARLGSGRGYGGSGNGVCDHLGMGRANDLSRRQRRAES